TAAAEPPAEGVGMQATPPEHGPPASDAIQELVTMSSACTVAPTPNTYRHVSVDWGQGAVAVGAASPEGRGEMEVDAHRGLESPLLHNHSFDVTSRALCACA
ncbi:MAG TPA: hypothetical protein VG815_08665, partial [Chloroflexota bacterium]|nr:hypothetical protein [Chloroflexota bacterium]